MNGFLVIDKSRGITSFDVIRMLRWITGVKKIGHCGTLDPMATGVLVVAIGEGTKLIEYLLKADKGYRAEVTFGAVSDTFDAEGVLVDGLGFEPGDGCLEGNRTAVVRDEVEVGKIKKVIADKFVGDILQVPPKYSALNIGGKKAYELAREGKNVEMVARKVRVDAVDVVEYEWPRLVLDVNCGSGTYIRSLAHDLGQELGCGGYLSGLRRTWVGAFKIEDGHELDFDIEDLGEGKKRLKAKTLKEEVERWLLSLDVAVGGLVRCDVDEVEVKALRFGQFIGNRFELGKGDNGAAFFEGEFIGVVEIVGGGEKVKMKKGIVG